MTEKPKADYSLLKTGVLVKFKSLESPTMRVYDVKNDYWNNPSSIHVEWFDKNGCYHTHCFPAFKLILVGVE